MSTHAHIHTHNVADGQKAQSVTRSNYAHETKTLVLLVQVDPFIVDANTIYVTQILETRTVKQIEPTMPNKTAR